MKSKSTATAKTTSVSRVIRLSAVLHYDGLENVGYVFTKIGRQLEHFVNLFVLQKHDGVGLFVEQIGHQFAHQFVGDVFQAIDLDAIFHQIFIGLQFDNGRLQSQTAGVNNF